MFMPVLACELHVPTCTCMLYVSSDDTHSDMLTVKKLCDCMQCLITWLVSVRCVVGEEMLWG